MNRNRSKFILLRDDDANFFTSPAALEQEYGFLFQRGLPLNFSVIPLVNTAATTQSKDFGPDTYEPFLPPDVAGPDQTYSLADNQPLVNFLQKLPNKEILQHGCEHKGDRQLYEFEATAPELLRCKLALGGDILAAAFGRRPTVFVAPQDQLSTPAYAMVAEQFQVLSLGWIDRRRLPIKLWPAYFSMKLRQRNYCRDRWHDLLITQHPGCVFSPFRNTRTELARLDDYVRRHDFTVIVSHHWEFFDRHGQWRQELHDLFKHKMLELAQACTFITFSELARQLAR